MDLRMLWAVHIDDGVLTLPWIVGGFVVAALFYVLGAWRIRDEEIPRIALSTAVFFVASTIHVPVGVTSAHMLGNGLLGVILGWRAALAIPVALLLQAMLLGHGGYLALGVNACVQIIPAIGASYLFRGLHHLPWSERRWWRSLLVAAGSLIGMLGFVYAVALFTTNLSAATDELDFAWANFVTFHPGTLMVALAVTLLLAWIEERASNAPEFPLGLLVGELTVIATAVLNCVVLLLGGVYIAGPALLLLVMHLPIALVEGILLGITVGFLRRVKPELLPAFRAGPRTVAPAGGDVLAGTCSRPPEARGYDNRGHRSAE